jgi:serine-type D-Ala-D-Ala carboxypeptidase/endopeptidase
MRPANTLTVLILSLVPVLQAAVPADVCQNMAARVAVGECPGIIIGMATPEGQFFATEGMASLGGPARGIGPETVFEVGSISKTFTTLLYQIALDGGLVKAADRAVDLLPAGLNLPAPVCAISLADLATHRSGLPRMPNNFKPANPRNPYADYSADQLYTWLRTVQPGPTDRFEYSNAGMGLLGHILELKTKSKYEALVRSWIATPLGLTDTCVTLSSEQRSRSATPHAGGKPIPMWDIPTLAGAGALRSTARDMLRWSSMQAGLLDSPLAAAMKKCQEPQASTGRAGGKVALGWMITPSKSGPIVWHNGGTGGTRSWTGFIRSKKTAVIVLANGTEEIDDIGFHLLSREIPLRTPQREVALPAAALIKCEGSYDFGSAKLNVKRVGRRLSVQLTGQPPNPAYAKSETEFFLRVVDAQLTFEPGEDGRMKSVVLHQNGRDQKATRAVR